jgi:hypothetical protein
MICNICKKDHAVKNEGLLTICELLEYSSFGSRSTSVGSDKNPQAFGTGNRFQFRGAR